MPSVLVETWDPEGHKHHQPLVCREHRWAFPTIDQCRSQPATRVRHQGSADVWPIDLHERSALRKSVVDLERSRQWLKGSLMLVAQTTDEHRHLSHTPCWSGSNQTTVVVSLPDELRKSLRAAARGESPTPRWLSEDASTSSPQFQSWIWRGRRQAAGQIGFPALPAASKDNQSPIHNCGHSAPSGYRFQF